MWYYRLGILMAALAICSCNLLPKKEREKNEFYEAAKIGDLYRIPLIQPHELTNNFEVAPWFFNLPYRNSGLVRDQVVVDEVGVSPYDSMMVFYAYSIDLPGQMTHAWFVVDMRNKNEKYFTDSLSYKTYIKNVSGEIRLFNCNEVYEKFKKSGQLPWIN